MLKKVQRQQQHSRQSPSMRDHPTTWPGQRHCTCVSLQRISAVTDMRLLGAKHIPTQSRTPDAMTTTTMSHLMLLSHPCSPSAPNCIVSPHALAFNTPHWSQRFRFFINSRAIACGATAYKMKHLPFDFKRARARNAIGSA